MQLLEENDIRYIPFTKQITVLKNNQGQNKLYGVANVYSI